MQNTARWLAPCIFIALCPFGLAAAMHWLAMLVPGTIKVDYWRIAASAAFVLSAVGVPIVLWKGQGYRLVRLLIALVVVAGLLLCALALQIRSACGDEPVFIGQTKNQVAVCK
jgi:hypothetical protein